MLYRIAKKEIGDAEFPLEADLETDLHRDHPPSDQRAYSVVSVAEHAAKDLSYVYEIVKHELIHYTLGTKCIPGDKRVHGAQFQAIAEIVALPPEYRD